MISRRSLLAGMTATLVPHVARAESPMYFTDGGAAIHGYDTVSYFQAGTPVRGAPEIAVMWKGATWHFASQQNREVFEANPRAFAPQFGGYCAYAVARGYLTSTDPNAWQIVDDRLYLVHSQQIERLWSRDVEGNIRSAEGNWPRVLYK